MGASGLVSLDARTGERTDLSLEVMRLLPGTGRAVQVGAWTSAEGLMWRGDAGVLEERWREEGAGAGASTAEALLLRRKGTLKLITVLVS